MERTERRNWVSILIKTVLWIGFLLLFLFALLHLPIVQDKITKVVVSSVLNQTSGKVKINRAQFNIYKGISLDGLVLTGMETDTLLTAGVLRISPKSTMLSFVNGDVYLNDIHFEDVEIRVLRGAEDERFNWQYFLGTPSDNPEESNGLKNFDLSQMDMQNVHFVYDDQKNGLSIEAHSIGFEIEIDDINLSDSTNIHLKRWVLTRPEVMIYRKDLMSSTDVPDPSGKGDSISIPHFYIDNFDIINGDLSYVQEREDEVTTMDYHDLDLILSDLSFEGLNDWELSLDDLSSITPFTTAEHFGIRRVQKKGDSLRWLDAELRTERSLVRFDLDIENWEIGDRLEDIQGDLNLKPSILYLKELFSVLPDLARNFENQELAIRPIQVEGKYQLGKNQIIGKDIALWVNGQHHFSGEAVIDRQRNWRYNNLHLEVEQLISNVDNLGKLYSGINIPDEVKRLGTIRFSGQFDGRINDFLASGDMKTDLGNTHMNVQIRGGASDDDSIRYAGLLVLDSFDLAGFLVNPDFGMVHARLNIANGIGPNLTNSDAELLANIDQFEYRGFTYRDAEYQGRLSRKIIDGDFKIKDQDLDFHFEGIVDLSESNPIFDFEINAETIDFCKLNLTDFPCQLSFISDVSFEGNNLKNANGQSAMTSITLRHDTTELKFDNILVHSREIAGGMSFLLLSDYLDAEIRGEFNLLKLYQAVYRQLLVNHQDQNKAIKLKDELGEIPDQNFTYDLKFKDARPLFQFLDIPLDLLGETSIKGEYNQSNGVVKVDLKSPQAVYDNIRAESLHLAIESEKDHGSIVLDVKNISRSNLEISDLSIYTDIHEDLLTWEASFVRDSMNRVWLSSESRAQEGGYFTEILEHELFIDSSDWTILPNPGIGIYKDRIDISGFETTDGRRSIGLKDINQTGIEVSLNDFNFEHINPLINYDKLYFTGTADSKLRIEDLFKKLSVQGFLEVPEFAINGDDFGTLLVRANQGGEDIIDLDMSITKDSQNLYTRGYLNTAEQYVNVDLSLENYPMSFFEYIITDGISETEGTTDVEAKIHGNLDDLKLSGLAEIGEAGVKIDYLGTFYRMQNEEIKIDENYVDLTGVQLIDARENRAEITGGLRHNFLGDFRTDLTINSSEFIALSTTNLDNPLYYGLGNGAVEVRFDGPFDAVNMRVTATTGPLTQLFIPITSTQYGYEESFVKFDYEEIEGDSATVDALVKRLQESGVDFEMNLTFTPDADISVIYDESTSNILFGRGRGNLRIKVARDGEFTVFGSYDIEEGEYRYTAYGFIAKPFTINRGGKVSWTGDPINANLEVTADYAGLRAPLNVLLQEYIESSTLQPREFSQRREVDLTMMLSGTLFNPAINFDIDFPNLTGELKTLADSKVRALSSTENGINNQVVGLLVFRDFLPDNNPFASLEGSTLGQSGNNTITEFLTSQLSLLFSDYLSEKLAGNGFIEGIDFEIAVAQNTSVLENSGQDLIEGLVDFVPDEVQLNLRNRFRNDNFVLSIGGNYVRQSEFETANDYLTGDFALDWFISEDKRLKLRFYGNYDYDEAFAERKQKYGFGINYRREFGSISKFKNILDALIDDINKVTTPPTTSNR